MIVRSGLMVFLAFSFFLGKPIKRRNLIWRNFTCFKGNTWNLKNLGLQYSNYHLIKADLNMA